MCRGGEIGRHAALRWLWEKSHRGSSPLSGTILRQRLRMAQPAEDLRSMMPFEAPQERSRAITIKIRI